MDNAVMGTAMATATGHTLNGGVSKQTTIREKGVGREEGRMGERGYSTSA